MNRFQYCVTTKADRSTAWDLYTDWEKWRAFANIYGELKWVYGEPWKLGSRMEIEVLHPVETTIQHSIVLCQPQREIAWIDRALGITISQWVNFEDRPSGGTQIYTEGDISPTGAMARGKSVDRLVRGFTETWYENFRAACDELSEMNSGETRA
jgi:hypothetical protein